MSESATSYYQIMQIIEQFDETLKLSVLQAIEDAKDISTTSIYDNGGNFKGELQQGDILLDMPVIEFQNTTDKQVVVKNGPCVVISNTCDLSIKKRGPRITYAPIVRASNYLKLLKKSGEDERNFDAWVNNYLKKQHVNKLIWLEPSDKVPYEGIIVLDHLLSASINHLLPTRELIGSKWGGSMNMAGWLFMVGKLTGFYYRPTDDQLLFRLGLNNS